MKQTAVEWLIDMLVIENEITLKGENYKLFEQAKQMEKEQIIESFKQGIAYWNGDEWKLIDIEAYYNQTFKTK